MANPCSVPNWLRKVIKEETHAQQECCQEHDEDYGRGGTAQDRAIADARLLLNLLKAGMPYFMAEMYWKAVRDCGESHWSHAGPWNWNEVQSPPEAP
jgi:hypothetical protein